MNILRILAWKNLKRNKKRTIATIIGIVVSVALISFILTLIYSFKYSMLETTKRNVGNYHIHIDQTTTQKAIEFAKMTDKIERIGISQTIGAANYESQLNTKNGIIIDGYDEVSLTNRDINLIEGRLPQNEKEILVSNYLINNLDEPIKIGDQLTLDVEKVKLIISNDGMQESLEPDGIERVTYTVTGIIQQTRKEANTSNAYIATTKLEQMTEVRPCEVTMLLKNPKEENLFYQELNNSSMQNHLSENNELLIWQGATKGMNEKSQLELIGVIAIIIVVAITIVLVRNSFQISISERMKEFGTLISIGATSKQIRKIVLIEGLIYAIISIPIGLIFGIGVVYFSINGIEKVLASTFGNSWIMEFSINIPFIFVTILITILAILFSCIKPIRKAKKASPIETIKQNNEIAIKNKDVKVSKLKVKLLGIEGQIAYKNIKRNKNQYRSTTISISIIMILVILISSIIQYIFLIVNNTYKPTNRNIDVGMIYGGGQEETDTVFKNFDRIKEMDSIIDYSIIVRFNGIMKNNNKSISIHAYEGNTYEDYLKSMGLKYEDTFNNGILLSANPSVKEGEILNIIINEKEYKIPIIKTTNLDPEVAIFDLDNSKIEKIDSDSLEYERLIISNDMAKKIDINDEIVKGRFSMDMRVNSSNPNKLEKEIEQFVNLDKIAITNYTKQKEYEGKFSAIMSIFLYGLLLVISLIGVTNIYNTITANVHLRKKELEVLKAIGMSNKQFTKMFAYESLIYGAKSLLIGIILGIILSYVLYCIIKTNLVIKYYFPAIQIVLMVVLTILVIYMSTQIASKSIIKISKKKK
jgi:putative ABC transport system permease protein